MARRVILDTNVLIDYERGTIDAATLDQAEIAIAAITAVSYTHLDVYKRQALWGRGRRSAGASDR